MTDRATLIRTRVTSDYETVELDRKEVYVLAWASGRDSYALVTEVEGDGTVWYEPIGFLHYRGPA